VSYRRRLILEHEAASSGGRRPVLDGDGGPVGLAVNRDRASPQRRRLVISLVASPGRRVILIRVSAAPQPWLVVVGAPAAPDPMAVVHHPGMSWWWLVVVTSAALSRRLAGLRCDGVCRCYCRCRFDRRSGVGRCGVGRGRLDRRACGCRRRIAVCVAPNPPHRCASRSRRASLRKLARETRRGFPQGSRKRRMVSPSWTLRLPAGSRSIHRPSRIRYRTDRAGLR
jgi:hypothetical protein